MDLPDGGGTTGGVGVWLVTLCSYLNREKKLAILDSSLRSDNGANPGLNAVDWTLIKPNQYGDWINQRSESYATHMPAHANDEPSIFEMRTNGLKTNRDAWNYNASLPILKANVDRMIAFYNSQVEAFGRTHPDVTGTAKDRSVIARDFADRDPTKFSWDSSDFQRIAKGEHYEEADALYMTATYRPFHRRHVNAGRKLNNRVYQLPKVYPSASAENLALGVFVPGCPAPFTSFAVSETPDHVLCGPGNPMQYLPRYVYDPSDVRVSSTNQSGFFDDGRGVERRRHNVTDYALAIYETLDEMIDKDDIFFYVYGILHSPDYRSMFAADLKKSLPRIPQVGAAKDFWAFSKAGRELAYLHTGYERVGPWPDLDITYAPGFDADNADAYLVEKTRFPKVSNPNDPDGRKIDNKTTIIYNPSITIAGIPERAHDYQLGSRSAIDWIVYSYQIKTDTASGIVNDPNDWAAEQDDPSYILDLVGRVVTVSMRTLDIVDSLPDLHL